MCNPITVERPDDLIRKGEHAGYRWEVVVNHFGCLCGYARVPRGHPWHGVAYDDVDASVHGGLTFGGHDVDCGKEEDGEGYWVGFDCAHAGDAPLFPPLFPLLPNMMLGQVRDAGYVESECIRLCKQAEEADR
jgi:hypothetical protein